MLEFVAFLCKLEAQVSAREQSHKKGGRERKTVKKGGKMGLKWQSLRGHYDLFRSSPDLNFFMNGSAKAAQINIIKQN